MPNDDREQKQGRQYPPFLEKLVPVALVMISFAVIIVIAIIFGVVLGLVPGS